MSMTTRGYSNGKPDVSWWLDQVRSGIEYRKKGTHQNEWPKWRKWYRGDFPRGIIPVNLYFRMLRTIVPRTYFRDPSVSVLQTKPGMEQLVFAQLIERVDNKLMHAMKMKNQMKRIIHNAWMFGTGAGKLGWGAEFTPTPEEFDTGVPEEFRTSLTRRVEYNSSVRNNMPWFMSVHTGSLIVPDGLMDFASTPWVGMWIKRPIDDVMSDPRLKHVSNLASSFTGGQGSMASVTSTGDYKKGFIDLVEIRDMRTHKVMVLAPYASDRVLYYEDDEMQSSNNRSNIYPVVFNPDDEYFWGVPDSFILEPQQLELNEIRTLQMKHRRISLVKLLYQQGAIDPAELEKLLNGDVGSAIQVKDLQGIDTFQLGSIPVDLLQYDQVIQGDVRDGMGFSRNQAGEYSAQKSHNAPTAVEARIVQAASDIRIDERRDVLADMMVDVFEDANELCFNHWQDEEVVQVMGPDALPVWVAFKPAMLKAAKYEIQIEPDSTLPETKDMKEAKAINLYNLLKTNPLIDPQMLTVNLIRNMQGYSLDQLIKNMATMQQQAAAGVPGSSPQNPINSQQLMQRIAQNPPPATGG